MRSGHPTLAALGLTAALLLSACGANGDEPGASTQSGTGEQGDGRGDVTVVVTTSILGDLVERIVGDDGTVTVVIPPGVDPHGFQASASDAAALRQADLVVANGLQLEENLVGALAAAEEDGVEVLQIAEDLDPIEFALDGPDDHGHEDDDDHAHDEDDDHGHDDDNGHEDEDDHAHGPQDPHVHLDPVRMADGARLIAATLADVDDTLDAEEWERRGEALADELLALHEELDAAFAELPDDRRVLVTNHDALGYLAARYDFEVLGTVIPGSSTQAEADARHFADLVRTIEETGVPAVFAENTDSTRLAEQLATEVGRGDLDLEVVQLYTDALGEPGSGADNYFDLMRLNAERIVTALQ